MIYQDLNFNLILLSCCYKLRDCYMRYWLIEYKNKTDFSTISDSYSREKIIGQ